MENQMMIPLDLRSMSQNGLERSFRTFLGADMRFLFPVAFHYSVWIL